MANKGVAEAIHKRFRFDMISIKKEARVVSASFCLGYLVLGLLCGHHFGVESMR